MLTTVFIALYRRCAFRAFVHVFLRVLVMWFVLKPEHTTRVPCKLNELRVLFFSPNKSADSRSRGLRGMARKAYTNPGTPLYFLGSETFRSKQFWLTRIHCVAFPRSSIPRGRKTKYLHNTSLCRPSRTLGARHFAASGVWDDLKMACK